MRFLLCGLLACILMLQNGFSQAADEMMAKQAADEAVSKTTGKLPIQADGITRLSYIEDRKSVV